MPHKNENRCWPGYEPVPGKQEHEQGSCRPKAESKMTPSEKKSQAARKRAVAKKSAAKGKTKTARKATARKATARKRTAA